jgi:peptide/nickel transport system permease protein
MLSFLLRRLGFALGLLSVVSMISFTLIHAPQGDYASQAKATAMSQMGMGEDQAEQYAQRMRVRLGLDRPLPEQYLWWVGNIVFHGDFGQSFVYNRPVAEVIGQRLPFTLGIALVCHLLATGIGIGLGIVAAMNQHRLGDTLASTIAFLGMTVPRFLVALVILYWLAFVVGSSNIGSLNSPAYITQPWSPAKVWDLAQHVWPVIAVATFGGLAYNLRIMRSNLLDVMRQPYIEAARARGLSRTSVVLRHAVPNALHPLVMHQGVILPYMISGELEVALVLSIPTIGPLMFDSLNQQDVFVTSTILLMLSAVLVVGNLLADLGLALLDPRIRVAS